MKRTEDFRLRSAGELGETLLRRVPKHIRFTFLSALILGFVTHSYAFLNKFTNHDDLNQMFYASYGAASGRWLLPSVLRLDGNVSMPWLIGVLSLLFLALTACLTVSLLRIRTPLGCGLSAALLVSFPAVTATFGYMFTASGYFFSLFLAVLAAWVACRRGWRGSLLGVILLTCPWASTRPIFPRQRR